ncbi:MAG TPA: VOC family protein [Chryseolinea sp.]|nr:VOC family protein [Chryseolinea sp.]
MITRLTHSFIYVLNLERAYDFYTAKLGFKTHTDIIVNGERWITICPAQQPDMQLLLMPVEENMIFKIHQVKKMQELIGEQIFSFGVFECTNLLATYEELKMKGVQFCIEPYKNKYLDEYEAAFFDDSGNWFRMTEKK